MFLGCSGPAHCGRLGDYHTSRACEADVAVACATTELDRHGTLAFWYAGEAQAYTQPLEPSNESRIVA